MATHLKDALNDVESQPDTVLILLLQQIKKRWDKVLDILRLTHLGGLPYCREMWDQDLRGEEGVKVSGLIVGGASPTLARNVVQSKSPPRYDDIFTFATGWFVE